MTTNITTSQAGIFFAQNGQEEFVNGWNTQYLRQKPAANEADEIALNESWGYRFADGSELWVTPGQSGNSIHCTDATETYYVSTTHGTVWSGKKSQMEENYCYGALTYYASEKEAQYSVRIRRAASYGRVSSENERAWVASLMAGRAVNVEGTIVNP